MARVLSFLIRYFSNYYTLHRSDLAARAAPLDLRLDIRERADLENYNKYNLRKTRNSIFNLKQKIIKLKAWFPPSAN